MANDKTYILLVEDDRNLGYLLNENLIAKGFDVTWVENGEEVMQVSKETEFDLCIFDVMLPEVDGFTIAAEHKAKYPDRPFIFLTARQVEKDRIRGFELGADDYIVKPFSFKELYYRMKVILKRTGNKSFVHTSESLNIGSMTFYPDKRVMIINNIEKKLSQREAGLLEVLLKNKGEYVARSELLKHVWGNDDYFTGKSMDVYITRIRKLLKDDKRIVIENLYGTGYRIKYDEPIIS